MKSITQIALLLALVFLLPACAQTYRIPQPSQPVVITIAPDTCPLLVYPNNHPIAWPYASDYEDIEREHRLSINNLRAMVNLPPFEFDTLGAEGARAHAFHMVLHNFNSPINPEGDDPFERYLLMGAYFGALHETVMYVSDLLPETMQMITPFIYATDVNHLAVGIWKGSVAGTYAVVYDFTLR